jgi:glycosyltransferase involved in cell wall biosynthesis
MRISIIIACWNSATVIGRCLESVIVQDYPDIEIVVADGGSSDGTVDVLRRYARQMGRRMVWLSEPDDGLADAWNKAVDRASGDWLLFLGADDALAAADVFARIAPVLSDAFPEYSVVYGKVALTGVDGRLLAYEDWPWSPADFRGCRAALPHQAVFHHRSLFDRYGRFDTSFSIGADVDFLMRALAHDRPLHVAGILVSNMQIGGMSTCRRNAPRVTMVQIRLYRRYVGGFPWLFYWWLLKSCGIWALHRLGGDELALPVTNFYRRVVGGRPPLDY